jgi:DNA phosphorothioation-associated putative methyltransferase
MSALRIDLQWDIRAFFGSYAHACRRVDERLFQAGDAAAIDEACRQSPVAKLLPNAFYVHRSAPESVDPLLRIYKGCARAYLGEIDGANLIKLHRHSGKVSYLVYPDFETDFHPALLRSVKLDLQTREIDCREFDGSANPPILHRKEAFLWPDDPLRAKFDRLTRQEERARLLDEATTIGTRQGWADRLRSMGYALRGHRLIRSSSRAEPASLRSVHTPEWRGDVDGRARGISSP